jgi:fructose transport system substrate-binding protein
VTAMENLLAREPDINVVYTINEPAAEGAYQALQNAGKTGVLVVSVDGGCPGIASVKDGVIGATSQQYPLLMASKGVEAIAKFAADGTKPSASDGLTFFNTGVNLVTDAPVDGVPSIDSDRGTELCWG